MEEKKGIIVDGKKVLIPEGEMSGVGKKKTPVWVKKFLTIALFLGFPAIGITAIATGNPIPFKPIVPFGYFFFMVLSLIFIGSKWGNSVETQGCSTEDSLFDDDKSWTGFGDDWHSESSWDHSSLSSDDMWDRWPSSSWDDWNNDVVVNPAYSCLSSNIWHRDH